MVINSFTAKNVHGIFNFNFDFDPVINFMVGINGSGKTSALKLMQAALSIDLLSLLTIKFTSLSIDIDIERTRFLLLITVTSEQIHFKLNDQSFRLENLHMYRPDNRDRSMSGPGFEYLENRRLELINQGGAALRKFMTGARPLFLGLERKIGSYDDGTTVERYRSDGSIRITGRPTRELLEGLDSCQKLVERAYAQYRRASDGRVDRLSNIILESTFEYVEFDPELLNDPARNPYQELSDLHRRREEIEGFVRDLGGSEKIVEQIKGFFTKMSAVVGESRDSKDAWTFEWFLNMAQVQRIRKILTEMDRQKRSAERFYAPIKEFCAIMNSFFQQSRKTLTIDSLGKIKITHGSIDVDLLSLSSGEKQLLILIAHSRFGSFKRNTFIVDEPELSLHMRWQEMLMDALLQDDKDNQYIFATHSPEIVGYRTEKCIHVG